MATSAAFVGNCLVGVIEPALLERKSMAISSFNRTGMERALLSSNVIEGATGGATKRTSEAASPITTLPVSKSVE